MCRSEIGSDYISESLARFSFGFLYKQKNANVGKRKRGKADEYTLKGFILCLIETDLPTWATIDLVCAREESKLGVAMMTLAEEELRKRGITLIQLNSLKDIKLKTWYEKLGYRGSAIKQNHYVVNSDIVGYHMIKELKTLPSIRESRSARSSSKPSPVIRS